MNLNSLLKCLPHYTSNSNDNPQINSFVMDSREVKKGSLFICIKGFTVDGHDFVEDAVKKGAVAIIAEKEMETSVPVITVRDTKRAMAVLADYFYDQPTQKLRLIGVTGTNGKTTVTHILEKIFRHHGSKTGLIGTINMKIGDKTYEVKNTTPESLLLQKTFHEMNEANVDTAFMEVSSHALHMGRVRGCDFNVAVFTNLSQDHLDYHETMDEYMRAKGLLFAQLGNHYDSTDPKYAILNADDKTSEYYLTITSARVMTYGIENEADVRAKHIKMTNNGTLFTLETPFGNTEIEMKFVGKFSIYNMLAAITTALVSNIKLSDIEEGIRTIEGVPGRFELINEGQDFSIIVDYAHTPDSLENVLSTVKQFAEGKTIVVVGCGGDRDKTKRPLMAQMATKYADLAVLTSDNPRTEDPEEILNDMERGMEASNFQRLLDRKEAIKYAISIAEKGDCIVIAGKGHETYQEIGKERFDFDDRKVARNALKERMS